MMWNMVRLVTFESSSIGKGIRRVGVQVDKEVVDLTRPLGIHDMRTFLNEAKYAEARQVVKSGKHRYPLTEVKIKSPIYNPEKIICVGLNYKDHAKESNMAIPSEPVLFSKYPSSIIGPDEDIVKPNSTQELDYEVELVAVMGKEGRNIKEHDAMGYVAGYTIGHDVSARDWQLKKPGGQWLAGKTFDTFCPLGPAIVTRVQDPHNLGIKCTVNDNVMQDSNTNQFIFKLDYLISYISRIVTLKPGDLIFTGTPPGVGFGRKPPVYLQIGDKVTCTIDELGSLSNQVIAAAK